MSRLLLISNSSLHGSGYLDHAEAEIKDFIGERIRVVFIPYALHERRAYTEQAENRLRKMGLEFRSVHDVSNPSRAIEQAEIIFIGGGNTFRLLSELQQNQLIEPIRRAVRGGTPFIGSSAGSIVACPSLKTTKDMPVIQPLSFEALALVPFQISPHYLDPDPTSTHMGETQEQRILQFLEENEEPVVGLREGSMLRVESDDVILKGPHSARIFRSGTAPIEAASGSNLRELLLLAPIFRRTRRMNSETVLFLSSHDVRVLLAVDECTAAVEHAFRLHGEGKTLPPGVLGLHVSNGSFHIKVGVLSLSGNYFAAKVNANFPDNLARFALPTIQGLVILCNADNGAPLAIIDSREITALRTAAATAVAAKYLARPDSRVLTICGCGVQGRAQLAAVARMFPLRAVFAYDKNPQQASVFASELSAELNIPITAWEDLAGCIRRCDICITCTTSHEPLVCEGEVHPGLFIAGVGADNPHKQEIHPEVMARSKIVCDVIEQCANMGDLHHALSAGAVRREDVHAELGEIVAGRKPGRESAEEIVVFDSTGMALQDVAAAALAYEAAIREQVGTVLQLSA